MDWIPFQTHVALKTMVKIAVGTIHNFLRGSKLVLLVLLTNFCATMLLHVPRKFTPIHQCYHLESTAETMPNNIYELIIHEAEDRAFN